jgi:hypothetical protein
MDMSTTLCQTAQPNQVAEKMIVKTDTEKAIMLWGLSKLRNRIETFGHQYGWEHIDNYTERLDKDGQVVWRVSDWEFVDNMYISIYNDHEFGFNGNTLRRLNKMRKKYQMEGLSAMIKIIKMLALSLAIYAVSCYVMLLLFLR